MPRSLKLRAINLFAVIYPITSTLPGKKLKHNKYLVNQLNLNFMKRTGEGISGLHFLKDDYRAILQKYILNQPQH